MEEIQTDIQPIVIEHPKLASASFMDSLVATDFYSSNPWTFKGVDKMESMDLKEYQQVVKSCRFFYKRDSIVSTVVNKMVDIGITDLRIERSKLSQNEFRIINVLKDSLQEFAENMALEFLISGLVVPEVKFAYATKDQLKEFGIKKYETLFLPVSMWLRDPETIKINSTLLMDSPSFYVVVPEDLIFFIMHEGMYPDGTKDMRLWMELKAYYPEFVEEVRRGAREVLLDNPWIIRRRPLSDSPYPIPYLYSAIEPLKHKRNLRRMDYSIASRVISAIQLFKMGSDEFPVTEDQSDQFDAVRQQMYYRNTGGRDVERIFQLFANHTLEIEWIFPPVEALLNEKKYVDVNQDIIFSMGFPRILITGESERTGTSDPEFATMSPIRTMEGFRNKIIKVINKIVDKVMADNNLKGETKLEFEAINLVNFGQFIEAVSKLYDTGNLSRETYANLFGFKIKDELETRADEKELLEKLGIEDFNQQPFTNPAQSPGNNETPPKPQE